MRTGTGTSCIDVVCTKPEYTAQSRVAVDLTRAPVIPSRSRWRTLLMQSGKTRARVVITGFSVIASVALVAGLMAVVRAPRDEWALWLLPAILVPLVVAPIASHVVLELAFELEVALARVAQQEAQLRAVVEFAPIGMARLSPHGAVRSANPRLHALLGTTEAQPLPAWTDVFVRPDDHAAFARALELAEPLDAVRWLWLDQNGSERTVQVSLVPTLSRADDGAVESPDRILLAEDVTAREAAASQLLRTQKLNLVGQLAGGLAHDFNNLLTVVRASVASLGGPDHSAELAAIDDAAVRGARLTRRLLAINRHDLLTLTPQSLAPLLHESVELMRRVLPARIRVDAPAEVPDVRLALDADAVQQVLLNLAINARDAIADAGVLRLEVREIVHQDARTVILALEDDGEGMSETVRARATEPFFTTKAPDAGTGLGLAMVFGIMQRHSGQLVLHSTPGAGTRAELWFPMLPDAHTPAPVAACHDPEQSRRARPAHLLLVEDERAVRLATERALQRLGYAVTSTPDMATALLHLASGTPVDLVVTDVMMPGGTGVELLQAVRSMGSSIPFLLVTGYATDNLDDVLAADGQTALLAKPWTLDRLAAQVQAMLPSDAAAAA